MPPDQKVAWVLAPFVEDQQPYGTFQHDSLAVRREFQDSLEMSQRRILAGIIEHSGHNGAQASITHRMPAAHGKPCVGHLRGEGPFGGLASIRAVPPVQCLEGTDRPGVPAGGSGEPDMGLDVVRVGADSLGCKTDGVSEALRHPVCRDIRAAMDLQGARRQHETGRHDQAASDSAPVFFICNCAR